jgi:hypothetical protein
VKEKKVNKVLANCLAMEGGLSTFERYDLGVEVAAYVRQCQISPKMAFVGKPPTIDGFAVRVGQNRGLISEVFSSQEEALSWLEQWPS